MTALLRAAFLAALAGCAAPAPPPAPAPEPADVVAALTRARDARLAGDRAGFVRYVRAADSLAPAHPALLLSLARGYAGAGDAEGAYRALERLAAYGLAADVAADGDFALVRGRPGFRELAGRLAAGAAPVVRSDTALVVADPDLIPESVAYDPVNGAFYLGSLAHNKVVRVAPDGSVADFARVGPAGRVIGVRIDPRRRHLWAVTVIRDPRAPRTFAGTGGRTALLQYELDTGRLLQRYPPGEDAYPHAFNDVVVAPGGDVYVTDHFGNAVYRIPAGSDRLQLFHGGGPRFHWPNGLDLAPDGKRLYVAHVEGITVLELESGRATPLSRPDGVAMADVDGLYACEGALVAVQRMPDFEQVARFRLSPSGDAVTAVEVLERRHPAYAQPTTGVVVGSSLYYVASSHFARLSDGRLTPAAKPAASVVLRLPLGAECRPPA